MKTVPSLVLTTTKIRALSSGTGSLIHVWKRHVCINPMELSPPVRVMVQNNRCTICVGTFRSALSAPQHAFDFLLGDVFMRDVYSVLNDTHGGDAVDIKGDFVQLLSRMNRDQVYANFEKYRRDSLRAYPPLFNLAQLRTDRTTDGGQLWPPPTT